MVSLVENNLPQIRALCEKHHVSSLYLFGSATANECFTPESDVDFLYRLNRSEIADDYFVDNFFDLLFGLEDLLRRKVDLVAEEKLSNPYLIQSINESKQKVYGS